MKKKLKVTELKLKSFVTQFGKIKGHTIKGGGGASNANRCSDYSHCNSDGGDGGYYDCGASDSCDGSGYYPTEQYGCTDGGGC